MNKVGFISLGCPKNLVDSEVMMGQLKQKGFQITPDAEEADTVVVNTCGFIESAKKESIEAILEAARLKTAGKAKRLVVAGCLVERYRDELKAAMPEVDAFIGTSQINDILSICDPNTNTRALPEISHTDGIEWVRVMYTYPTHISDAFLDVLAEEPKAVKYLDMPLQHASQNVLKLMKRGGNRASLERLINRVLKRVPGIGVRTTFITGFPGETDRDFEELL